MGILKIQLLSVCILLNGLLHCHGISVDYQQMNTDFMVDENLDSLVASRMRLFEDELRQERIGTTPSARFTTTTNHDDTLFETPSDFYELNGINLDFGNSHQIVIKDPMKISTLGQEGIITDLEIVRLDDGHHLVLVATTNGPNILRYHRGDNLKPEVLPSSLSALTLIRQWETTFVEINDGQPLLVVLALTDDRYRSTISWYSWMNDRLHENGTLYSFHDDEQGSVLDMKTFAMPVIGSSAVAVRMTNVIRIFLLTPLFRLEPCAIVPVAMATDMEPFTVNGQTYVAVTNSKSTTVWKYRTYDDAFVLQQRMLAISSVTDVHFFSVGFEHFLGVISVTGATVYQWRGALFVRIQTLKFAESEGTINTGTIWHGLVDESAKAALPVLLARDGLRFFVWDKGLRKFSSAASVTDERLDLPLRAVSWPEENSRQMLQLLIATGHNLITFRVQLDRTELPTLTKEQKEDVFGGHMQKMLDKHEERLNRFANLVSKMESEVEDVHVVDPEVELEEPCSAILINSRLITVEDAVRASRAELKAFKDRSVTNTVELKDRQSFRSLTVLGTAEFLGDLRTNFVNGLNVSHFFADSLMENVASDVLGSKTFNGRVTFKKRIRVVENLDGYIPDDLVRLDQPQTMHGSVRFMAPVTVHGDVGVRGRVNNFDLSKEAVLLKSDAPQTLEGEKTFVDDVDVLNRVLVKGTINGVKLSKLGAGVVTSSGRQTITGNKIFSKMTIRGEVVAQMVNGLDVNRLDATVVRADRRMKVKAPKTFVEPVIVDGNIQVDTLNGLRIPEDLVLVSSKTVTMLATKMFPSGLSVQDLVIGGTVDRVDLSDTVKIDGDQELIGSNTFLGEVHFAQLEHRSDKSGQAVVVHGDLYVDQSINGVQLKDLMFRNETSLTFEGPMTFQGLQNFQGTVHVNGRLNGFDLRKDFLLKHSNENEEVTVTGKKTFLKPVIVDGDLDVSGRLDGVHLATLQKDIVYLESETPQMVYGRKTFVDGFISVDSAGIYLPHLTVADLSLDGLNMEQMTVRGDLMIDGGGHVNGYDFRRIYDNRMTLTTEQHIRSKQSISGDWTMENLVVHGLLNDHNVSTVWEDVLWKNAEHHKQLVSGQKVFTGRVDVSRLYTLHGVDGVSIVDLEGHCVPITDNGVIRGSLYNFDGGLVTTDIQCRAPEEATINDVALSEMIDGHGSAKGMDDLLELNVEGDVWVSDTVNGLVLERDVLTVHTPQKIPGNYELHANVLASHGVTVGGLGGSGTIRVRSDVVVDVLSTGGNINGIDVRQLQQDTVMRNARFEETINGMKRLDGSTKFRKNLSVVKSINGRDYGARLDDIVRVDGRTQVLTGKKTFSGRVDVIHEIDVRRPGVEHNLKKRGEFEHGKRLGPHFVEEDVTIDGSLTILGDVHTHQTINGIRISKDVLLKSGNQRIAGHKKVDNMYVDGDVSSHNENGCILEKALVKTMPYTVNGTRWTIGQRRRQSDDIIHFHGRVKFLKGISQQTRSNDGSLSLRNTCPLKNCIKPMSVLQKAAAQKYSGLESLRLVHQVNTTKISVVELASDILTVGFASCKKPLEIYRWHPRQARFILKETGSLFLVRQIKVVPGYDETFMIIVHHLSCSTGVNMMTMYSVTKTGTVEIRDTFEDFHKGVEEFDAAFLNNRYTLLMVTLLNSSRMTVERFTLGRSLSKIEFLANVDIPAGGKTVKMMAIAGERLLAVSFATKTIFYRLEGDYVNRLINLDLDVPSQTAWTVDARTGFLVAGRETLKIYKVEFIGGKNGHLSISEAEEIAAHTAVGDLLSVNSVHLEEPPQAILTMSFTNLINLFSKDGSSNFVSRIAFAANVQHAASTIIKSSGQVVMVTRTVSGWDTYVTSSANQPRLNG